jgi:hypothetical protein
LAVGSYVFVRALPWNKYSHRALDIIGLVSHAPPSLREWLDAGNINDLEVFVSRFEKSWGIEPIGGAET